MQTTIKPYGDNFAFVIPVDAIQHTSDKPFCWNSSCPCHADPETYIQVQQFVYDGLMTPAEATDYVAGKTV